MEFDLSDDSDFEIIDVGKSVSLAKNPPKSMDGIDVIELSITDDSSDDDKQPVKEKDFLHDNADDDFLDDHQRIKTPMSKRKLKNVNNNQSELFLKSPEQEVIKLNQQDKEKLFLNSDHEKSDFFGDLEKGSAHKRRIQEIGNASNINKRQKTKSNISLSADLSDESIFGANLDSPISKQKEVNNNDIVILELSDSSDDEKATPQIINNTNLTKAEALVTNFFANDDLILSQGNKTENSIMLKVQEIISDLDSSIPQNNVVNVDKDVSNWEITPHVDYLATIRLNAIDLDLQLREIHKTKLAKQRYTQANKVNRVFKSDIVEKELWMISNLDLTMKNNQQDCFYIQNGDLLIKKREEEFLKRDVRELVRLVPELRYATFMRRLTSVYELNSDIFLPITDLMKIGNRLNNDGVNIDFVDVDMSETLFLIDVQKLFEIFHFKEYTNVKKKFEDYLMKNKKITMILTSFNKFKTKLNKWENSRQLQQFNSLHQTGNATAKSKKNLIPEEYLNISLNDINEFILRLQMTYPTHVHCQIIETEITFINDWMLNYLKTILRRRYTDKKENVILKSKAVTSQANPFDNFLLSLSGITPNNVTQISTTLGSSYQSLEKNIARMNTMNQYKGTEKKIINLLYKFINSKHKDELL